MRVYDRIGSVPAIASRLAEQNRVPDRAFDFRRVRLRSDLNDDFGPLAAASLVDGIRPKKQAANQEEVEERPKHQLGG